MDYDWDFLPVSLIFMSFITVVKILEEAAVLPPC